MVPYDLPLHAGIMPRLLITIIGEPLPCADRYSNHPASVPANRNPKPDAFNSYLHNKGDLVYLFSAPNVYSWTLLE